jgi:hypothetical protein
MVIQAALVGRVNLSGLSPVYGDVVAPTRGPFPFFTSESQRRPGEVSSTGRFAFRGLNRDAGLAFSRCELVGEVLQRARKLVPELPGGGELSVAR